MTTPLRRPALPSLRQPHHAYRRLPHITSSTPSLRSCSRARCSPPFVALSLCIPRPVRSRTSPPSQHTRHVRRSSCFAREFHLSPVYRHAHFQIVRRIQISRHAHVQIARRTQIFRHAYFLIARRIQISRHASIERPFANGPVKWLRDVLSNRWSSVSRLTSVNLMRNSMKCLSTV